MQHFRQDATRLAIAGIDHREDAITMALVVAQLDAAIAALDARRLDDERALGVAVINRDGVVVRVVHGTGPLAVVAGRHEGCDLFLPHGDASLRHFVAVADDLGVDVVDLGSLLGVVGTTRVAAGALAIVRSADSVVVVGVVAPGQHFVDGALPGIPLRRHTTSSKRLSPSPSSSSSPSSPSSKAVPTMLPLSVLAQQRSILIGRQDRCDLVVDLGCISRVHAAVVPVTLAGRRRALLVDAGTTNGTSVITHANGRVVERALGPLLRGCVVDEGDLVLLADDVRLAVVGSVGVRTYAADRGNA